MRALPRARDGYPSHRAVISDIALSAGRIRFLNLLGDKRNKGTRQIDVKISASEQVQRRRFLIFQEFCAGGVTWPKAVDGNVLKPVET